MRPFPGLPLLAAALLAPLVLAPAASAQGIIRPAETQRAPNALAPALPGLAARSTPAPIAAGPGTAALAPNAALFDAIGRGDLAAARDAVARGANIEARNALGLSPLDAAVDQGRNEIAFYLLSARDRTRSAPPAQGTNASAAAAASAARVAAMTSPPQQRRAPLNAPPAVAAEPVGAVPWSGNGGAAQPEVGFLGFDAGRPADATPPTTTSRRARP
ncbi:hypothetical protein ACVFYP_13535 [Roseomonas sp. F4]